MLLYRWYIHQRYPIAYPVRTLIQSRLRDWPDEATATGTLPGVQRCQFLRKATTFRKMRGDQKRNAILSASVYAGALIV
jgi:hypothetical protein